MKLLAFDTALGRGAAGVVSDGVLVSLVVETETRSLAERLLPMIEQALDEAGLGYADLDRLAVTIGPGTFTGLRIGLAAARGLRAATGLPLIGLTTLEALAVSHADRLVPGEDLMVAIDARRGQVFLQTFTLSVGKPVPRNNPVAVDIENLENYLPAGPSAVAGSGARFVPAHAKRRIMEDSSDIDIAAMAIHAAGLPAADAPPSPLYLRAPDAKLPAAS